ncbi:MAG: MFS transporter [Phaeodactylibacter sp.]|nr:MFS transporter [Phaeodactylibacter sp.]MCB9276208.1 MFS transporter [Lewinellaceae bacterium]
MKNWRIKLSLFLNYFVFAILLNSVGTVILQVQNNFGVTEATASTLEAFKDLSIAITSFLIASYIVRIGYKRAMLLALGFIAVVALAMPSLQAFWATRLLFAATGISFALIKVSVFATIGLVTDNEKEHVSFMNFLESFFMVGVLSGYFIFSAFVDDTNAQSTDWFRVYYMLAAIALAAFLLLFTTRLDESRVQQEEKKSLPEEFGDMLKLIIRPLVLIFIISVFLYVLIEQGLMSWLPSFNKRVFKLPTSLSIQMTSILALSLAVGRFAGGLVLKKLHWFKVLSFCIVAAGVLMLISLSIAGKGVNHEVTGWSNAPLAAYLVPLIGISLAPIYPAINSVILSKLPVKQHAPMSGLIVVFSALGGTTGSIITGNLFGVFAGKEQIAFYLLLIPMAIILFVLYFFKKETDKIPFEGGTH